MPQHPQTKNRESLIPSIYTDIRHTSPTQQQDDVPYFHVAMPNYWGDFWAHSWNTSLTANAVDLLDRTGDHTPFTQKISDIYNNPSQGLGKLKTSDDFSTYNESALFDIGSVVTAMMMDVIPISLAGAATEGVGWGIGVTGKALQFGALTTRMANRLPSAINTIQKGFKAKGVGDNVSNKVARELYTTFSRPQDLLKAGNVIGLYSAAHDGVNQRLYERNEEGELMYGVYADDASWHKSINQAEQLNTYLNSFAAGALFPVGAAAGKGVLSGATKKYAGQYISQPKVSRGLQKVTDVTGEIAGGGWAFNIPSHGLLPLPAQLADKVPLAYDIQELYHSMGVVAGLRGSIGIPKNMYTKARDLNRAHNKNLTESEMKEAQKLTETSVESNFIKNDTFYGKNGEVVRAEGKTLKNNIKYRIQQADGTWGNIKYMDSNTFLTKKYNLGRNVEALPETVLNNRILELATELGANTPKQRRDLFYGEDRPMIKGERISLKSDGLDVLAPINKHSLLKKLQKQQIGENFIDTIKVEKSYSPPRLPFIGRLLDIVRVDAPQALQAIGFKSVPRFFERMASHEARITRKMSTDHIAIKMWRSMITVGSKIKEQVGELVTKFDEKDNIDLHQILNTKGVNWNKVTGSLESGKYLDHYSQTLKKLYDYAGQRARESGVIPDSVPLEQFYSPRYMNPKTKIALKGLQEKMSEGKLDNGDLLRAASENSKLNPAEAKVVESIIKKWSKNADKGAVKYLNKFFSEYTKEGKIDWNLGFKELNKELNLVDSNPIHNFTTGRTTDMKWDAKKNGYDSDIWITDARVNVQRYVQDLGKAMVERKVYGKNNEILIKTIEILQSKGKNAEVRALTDLNNLRNVSKFYRGPGRKGDIRDVIPELYKGLVLPSIEVISNIFGGLFASWGIAPIYNWTQPTISYLLLQGFTPGIQAALSGFSRNPKNKKFLKETGTIPINKDNFFDIVYGEQVGGRAGATPSKFGIRDWSRRVSNWMSQRHPIFTGFTDWSDAPIFRKFTMKGSTQAVHESGALAAMYHLPVLWQKAKTGRGFFEGKGYGKKLEKELETEMHGGTLPESSLRIEKTKAKARQMLLDDYGIYYKPGTKLTRKQMTQGAAFNVDHTQLVKNPASEAYYMSHPGSRAAFRLKTFMIKQTKLYHNWIARQLEWGNAIPLTRLAIAGATGQQLIKLRNLLHELTSGKEQLSRDDEESLLDGLVTVGASGFALEIMGAEDRSRALGYAVTPLFYSVGVDLYLDFQSFITEGRLLSFEEMQNKAPAKLAPYLTGPMKGLAQRFEDYENQKNRLDFTMRLERNKLFDDWENAQKFENESDRRRALDKIQKRIIDWDMAYGYISPMDLDGSFFDYVYKKKLEELKKEKKEEEKKKIRYRY